MAEETSDIPDESRIISVLAGSNRRSHWMASPLIAIFSVFARSFYDFRQAQTDGDVITINAWCIFGSITFVVPEGTDVQLSGISFLASADSNVESTGATSELPRIVITANTVFGKLRVRTPKPEELAAAERLTINWSTVDELEADDASNPVEAIGENRHDDLDDVETAAAAEATEPVPATSAA